MTRSLALAAAAVHLTFTLPNVNVDGSPLTDLAHVWVIREKCGVASVLYDFPARWFPAGSWASINVPADSSAIITVRCVDSSGNVSPASNRIVPWAPPP